LFPFCDLTTIIYVDIFNLWLRNEHHPDLTARNDPDERPDRSKTDTRAVGGVRGKGELQQARRLGGRGDGKARVLLG
jgi:hypothetical protein